VSSAKNSWVPVNEDARDDFNTDQMKSLSFLYGEGAQAPSGQQRQPAVRQQRGDGPRHVGRTQHPADFTASKYLGDGALKSSRQRKSSDYKNPASSQRKGGARHSAVSRGESRQGAQPGAQGANAGRTQVVSEPADKDATRVIEGGLPAGNARRAKQQSTRVLPSERARVAAIDETQVAPTVHPHTASSDATRVAPSKHRTADQPGEQAGKGGKRGGKRRGRRVVVIVVVLIIALIAVCAALLFRSAQQVQTDALELNKVVSTIADDFRMGDFDKVAASVDDITEIADRMRAETSSPLWKAASALPVVGEDAGNAITLCETIDTLSDEVLVPLSQDLPKVTEMSAEEQVAFAKKLATYNDKVSAAKELVSSLEKGNIDQLNSAIEKAEDLLGKAEILLGG
jgi:hypothetical protein